MHDGELLATIDGQEVRMPAGSVLGIEPEVKRKLESAASPTTLLIVGGTPGKAYEIGPWEQ